MANLHLAIFFVNNAPINTIVGKLLDLFVIETMKKIVVNYSHWKDYISTFSELVGSLTFA